jgi:DNA-binding LytR/AlgR family response regulator
MKKEFIIFKTGRKEVRKLDLDTILYIRAEGSYTRIITITKEEILIANNLG